MNTNAKVKRKAKATNIGQPNITFIQWLSLLFISENMALNPLNSLTSIFKKQLMKGKIYKRKSSLLIRKCRSFPPLWSKFIPLKKYRACYKEYTANPSDKAFFEEYKAQITLYENALSELKKSIPNSQIQRIF